jgi:TonB family protein
MQHTAVKTTSTLLAGLFVTTMALSTTTPTAALIVVGKDPCRTRTRSLDKLVVTRVRPRYPPERGFHASGDVLVKVMVNEQGSVESARAICGHPLLFALAIGAVMKWKFRPFARSGKVQKMKGVVTVHFPPDDEALNTMQVRQSVSAVYRKSSDR